MRSRLLLWWRWRAFCRTRERMEYDAFVLALRDPHMTTEWQRIKFENERMGIRRKLTRQK